MPRQHEARLPLQIGTSSLAFLARGAAAFVPGALFSAFAFAVFVELQDELGDVGGKASMVVVVPALGLLFYAGRELRRAWAARPSDLRVREDALAIDGGPHHGRVLRWSALGDEGCRVDLARKKGNEDRDEDVHRLVVRTEGKEIVLAIAENEGERRSLEEVAATVRAARAASKVTPPPAKPSVEVLACAGCGATLAPLDAETVRCAHCGGSRSVPEEMRARVRAAAEIARRPDEAVAALLRQPSASTLGVLFGGIAVVMGVAWPVALLVLARAVDQRAATVWTGLALLLFVASGIGGLYALLRDRLVDRLALRLVLLDFAAEAPAATGEPYRCRSCLAPLTMEVEPAHVVVRCAYCGADNVLVRDLRRSLEAVRAQNASLASALDRRAKERTRLRGLGIGAVALLTLSVWSLTRALAGNPIAAPLERRCASGDADACVSLAELYASKTDRGVKRSPERAMKLYEGACERGIARACVRAADMNDDFLVNGSDRKKAAKLRARACEAGVADACLALARAHEKGNFLAGIRKDAAKARELHERACDGGIATSCASSNP